MASLNPITRELVFKVVFCGPGLGGKTTTLERLHEIAPPEHRGQLVSLATASDRTLYFDFLPLRLPKVRGLGVRLQLFTVPGQVHYAATRKLVLTGCDGVVFVADAQRAREEANVESLEDLEANLVDLGRTLASTPHVMQWNKMDLAELTEESELEAKLNKHHAPSFATVAKDGRGVADVLEAVARATIDSYMSMLPQAPSNATQKIQFKPEGVGLATAVREWTEGKERDVEELDAPGDKAGKSPTPLTPRSRHSQAGVQAVRGGSSTPPRATPPPPAAQTTAGKETSFFPSTARTAPAPPGVKATTTTPPTTTTTGAPSSHSPASHSDRFSLAELFPDEERTDVRGIEELVETGDTRGAVLACEMLVARALSRISEERGAAWLLAGLDAGHYRAFRSVVEAAQRNDSISKSDALSCLVWTANAALAARR